MLYLAPAKLNLFLHILGRRADGYHELETVFQLVDLCDEVTITTRSDGRIVREPPPDDPVLAALADEDDLTVRAARLLQKEGAVQGASIHVRKRIPAGGGMGGGSSNAATVLLALNRLWGLDLPLSRLAQLGLSLGSDVPVFVYGQTSFASGRGEVLTPVATPSRWFVVVRPQVMISTREIFSSGQLTRDTPPLRIRALPMDGGRNDCESVVRNLHPEVAAVLERLAPWGARLTGTGACVFVPTESRAAAEVITLNLSAEWSSWIVHGMSHAPQFPA